MNDLAFVFLGGFSRLGPNFGVMKACRQASEVGFIPPDYAVGSSAANIDLLIASQWDRHSYEVAEEMMVNLKRKHFASLNPRLKRRLFLELLATTALLLPTHLVENKYIRYGTAALLAGLAFYSEEKMIEEFFKAPSLLVYDNLKKLLGRTVNFDKVFSSPIKIEVPAVNLNKAGWTLDTIFDPTMHLKGWSVVNNFEPQFVNLPKEVRDRKMLNTVVSGARVFGFFNPEPDENGDYLTDTAAKSNIPIQFAIRRGYTNIVVFVYNCTNEGPIDTELNMLVKSLPRNFDVLVAENTRKVMLGHLRVNNDLDQLKRQTEALRELELFTSDSDLDPDIRQAIIKYIKEKRESDEKLSYAKKKRLNILFLGSEYLPPIHFSHFKKADMERGIQIGEKVFWDNARKIEEMREHLVKSI